MACGSGCGCGCCANGTAPNWLPVTGAPQSWGGAMALPQPLMAGFDPEPLGAANVCPSCGSQGCACGSSPNWLPVTGAPQSWGGAMALPQPLMAGFEDPEPMGNGVVAKALSGKRQRVVIAIQHAYGINIDPATAEYMEPTADNLIPLLQALHEYTERLEARDRERRVYKGIKPGTPQWEALADGISHELVEWRLRLDWYTHEAQSATPTDTREAVLWTVTAPLLMGHYRGPEGDVPVMPAAYWGDLGPPSEAVGVPDLAAPLALAAALAVPDLGISELVGDMKKAAKDLADKAAKAAWDALMHALENIGPVLIGGAFVVLLIVAYLATRK